MASSSSNSPKRGPKEELLDSAVELLANATLDDLLTFLSVRKIADKWGQSHATVSYHFASRTQLLDAVINRAFARYESWSYEGLRSAVTGLIDGTEAPVDIASAIATQVGRFSPGPDVPPLPQYEFIAKPVSFLEALHAVVAPNDIKARTLIADLASAGRKNYVDLVDPVVSATGRVWKGAFSAQRFATLTQALSEGFVYLRRFDPAAAPLSLYAASWLELLNACTIDPDDLTEQDVASMLAQIDKTVAVADYAVLCRDAWAVYRDVGARQLRHDRVAAASSVRLESVLLVAPRGQDLRAAAFCGGIAAGVERHHGALEAAQDVHAYLRLIAEFAYNHPRLAEAYQRTSPSEDRPTDDSVNPPSFIADRLGRPPNDARSHSAVMALISIAMSSEVRTPSEVVEIVWPVLQVAQDSSNGDPTELL